MSPIWKIYCYVNICSSTSNAEIPTTGFKGILIQIPTSSTTLCLNHDGHGFHGSLIYSLICVNFQLYLTEPSDNLAILVGGIIKSNLSLISPNSLSSYILLHLPLSGLYSSNKALILKCIGCFLLFPYTARYANNVRIRLMIQNIGEVFSK